MLRFGLLNYHNGTIQGGSGCSEGMGSKTLQGWTLCCGASVHWMDEKRTELPGTGATLSNDATESEDRDSYNSLEIKEISLQAELASSQL